MTPYEIDILLHYYARCDDHSDIVRRPPIYEPTMGSFVALDLLEAKNDDPQQCWQLTGRGRAYCEALQRVPLPEQQWVIKWPTDEPHRRDG